MPRRVYHPDHTGDIRQQLKRMTAIGAIGLLVDAVAAGIVLIIADVAEAGWLTRIAWVAVAMLLVVCLIFLAATAVFWAVYRRRRADLDAAGAEAVGEFLARTANRGRPDKP